MKNTASIQKNNEIDLKVRGMYGSTVNRDSRSFNRRSRTVARAKTKVHPGEAGIVSGHRIRIESPSRPALQSLSRLFTLRGIILLLLSFLAVGAAVILMLFNFERATVYGNTKYSQEQIESFITRGTLGENTFVMALKYHHRKVTDIPFVDRIDIDIVNPSTVRVNIVEKPTDGCISYKGNNVYVSGDGIIQTVSGRAIEDTTVINGVVLTHSNTGSQVLAKNQLGLDLSLEVLRATDKYGIRADAIDVDSKSNLTVTFGDVKVLIGKTGYDHKMFKMHQILPYLDGRSGTIYMTGYEYDDTADSNIVLCPAISAEQAEEAQEQAEMNAASEGASTEVSAEQAKEAAAAAEQTETEEKADAAKAEESEAQKAAKEEAQKKSAEEKAGEAKKETTEKTAEETKKEAAEKTVEETKKETTEKTAEETKKEAAEKTAEETKKEAAEKTAEETRKEAAEKTTEETKKESAEKADTQAAEKTENKAAAQDGGSAAAGAEQAEQAQASGAETEADGAETNALAGEAAAQ